MIHVCFGVSDNCINHYSYGEICVHCGCCEDIEPNKEKMLNNQIKYYNECIEENNNFSNWDSNEKWRKVQEENGITLPFTFVGTGQLRNPRKGVTANGSILYDIHMDNKLPDDLMDDFKWTA